VRKNSLEGKQAFLQKEKETRCEKGGKKNEYLTSNKTNGNGNGHLTNEKSRPSQASSLPNGHSSIFDPMQYMLKLPKHKE
jgi:hypothetical protein